ncbi:MAG: HD domain-containing protein, partial [Pseudomonadota bacterium]|nr:HD domain-containing protein [Pseudomonadota bacterium]
MATATVKPEDRSRASRPPRGVRDDEPFLTKEELAGMVLAYQPDADRARLHRAYDFAREKHGDQLRQSGDPYYSHPVRVATLLSLVRLDEATIMAGLLHDTVEDCDDVDLALIEKEFGSDVAELVDGVTKLDKIKFTRQEHKQAENFRKMLVAMSRDIRVLLIKLADRLH